MLAVGKRHSTGGAWASAVHQLEVRKGRHGCIRKCQERCDLAKDPYRLGLVDQETTRKYQRDDVAELTRPVAREMEVHSSTVCPLVTERRGRLHNRTTDFGWPQHVAAVSEARIARQHDGYGPGLRRSPLTTGRPGPPTGPRTWCPGQPPAPRVGERSQYPAITYQRLWPGMLSQLGLEPPAPMMRVAARRSGRRYRKQSRTRM
jgi:hypothetical protein